MPLLKRFIQFSFVITVISAFSALFSLIFVMTNGGPGFGTTTLEFFVYQSAFSQGQFGTGALYGIILFVDHDHGRAGPAPADQVRGRGGVVAVAATAVRRRLRAARSSR